MVTSKPCSMLLRAVRVVLLWYIQHLCSNCSCGQMSNVSTSHWLLEAPVSSPTCLPQTLLFSHHLSSFAVSLDGWALNAKSCFSNWSRKNKTWKNPPCSDGIILAPLHWESNAVKVPVCSQGRQAVWLCEYLFIYLFCGEGELCYT